MTDVKYEEFASEIDHGFLVSGLGIVIYGASRETGMVSVPSRFRGEQSKWRAIGNLWRGTEDSVGVRRTIVLGYLCNNLVCSIN